MDKIPAPEWVKLIPADSIPVFCLSPDTLDSDLERIGARIRDFFGDRKALVVRGDVQIYAIADQPGVSTEGAAWAADEAQSRRCICGGEPHVSHCPANPDPFLRGLL